MKSKEERAQEIQVAIRQILLHDWDPIGVADVEQAHDEYDSYIGGVYRLLASGASPQKVAEHLCTIARESMGFESTCISDLLPAARKLCELDVRLDTSKGQG